MLNSELFETPVSWIDFMHFCRTILSVTCSLGPEGNQHFFAPLANSQSNSSSAFCSAVRSQVFLARTASRLATCLVIVLIAGCGGGEDFSTPIQGVAERLTKSSEQNAGNHATAKGVETQPPQKNAEPAGVQIGTEASHTEATQPDSKDATMPVASTVDGHAPAEKKLSTGLGAPTTPEKAQMAVASKSAENETITDSGQTAKSLAVTKEENSDMTAAANAGGLLGGLKGSKSAPAVNTSVAPKGDEDATHMLSRFGRTALSQHDWLRLVTRLSRRFHVATSQDGSRILASSGERSGDVIQIGTIPELSGPKGTSPTLSDEVLQTVTSLPAQVSCVELTGDGTTALFGTNDGRVLVRMISSKYNWDLYARDLFLFQDEIRPTARLGEDPIVLLKEINGGQLLSINAKGQCRIWRITDIIQPLPPIGEISVTNSDSVTSATVSPTPIGNFEIKRSQILGCCESTDGQWVAIVLSNETIMIIETKTGVIADQLNAGHFADTQPVSVAFLPERQEIITGLADGRILRRAFGKEVAPVAGVDGKGDEVDYDAVFIPDVRDPPDPITTIALIPGTSLAYVGSLTGTISRLDISQRRMELLPSKQAGAILELKVCSFGTLSIGDERRATIFDQPVTAITRQSPTPRTLELPTDNGLHESEVGQPETVATRRPTTQSASLRESPVDLEMVGIRPSNPELTVLHHQLRTAINDTQRQSVRRAILTFQGKDFRVLDPSASVGTETSVLPTSPVLLSEFTTDYLFNEGAWQDVRMLCSLDGRIAVLSHSSRPAIIVVDMSTGVVLRRWTEIPSPRSHVLNEQYGRLVPSAPAAAELNLATGESILDPMRRYLVCAVSPDQKSTVLGHFGSAGLAAKSLTLINEEKSSRTHTHEMFESMVTALAYSIKGDSLYAAFRSRDQTTLQELDPLTLAIRSTLITEPMSGAVPRDFSAALDDKCGTTFLLSSAANRSLLTYGTFEDGPQLRLWRRSSKGWPKESVLIFREDDQLPDSSVFAPAVFVNQTDSKVAVVTSSGLSILNTKKEKLESKLPIPDVGGRRPSCCFAPNAKWIFVGDADGTIWVLSLSSPSRKPLTFQAHAGPIAGLSISADGKFLLTAGEDNRIRSWFLGEFPGP